MALLASLTRPHDFVGFLGICHTPTPPCWLSWHLPHSHTTLLASLASPHFLLFNSPRTTLLAFLSPLHDCVGFLVIFYKILLACFSLSSRLCWLPRQLPNSHTILLACLLFLTRFGWLACHLPHDFVGLCWLVCYLPHDFAGVLGIFPTLT